MTTTDPTITIAGLRAQVESLETSLRAALDDGATSEEVRLIAAAENACLTAERDALAAQLAEVRAELSSDATKRDGRISAICRALDIDDDRDVVDAIDEMRSRHANDLASERAHLAAGRTRIAGLEQAANERSAEVARLTARVAELEARPVLDEARLAAALDAHGHAGLARKVFAHLGPVTLPAQDRAEELCNAYIDEFHHKVGHHVVYDAKSQEERYAAMRRALASLGAPPTSPPAARPVFAGVSVQDLRDTYEKAYWSTYDERIKAIRDSGERPAQMPSRPEIALRAVLARLEVSLVTPVDPEAVARSITETGGWVTAADAQERRQVVGSVVRATLTAAGIPVTPEVGK